MFLLAERIALQVVRPHEFPGADTVFGREQ
jgi:hypothetical protein